MIKLNLGCGIRHMPQEEGWVNVDIDTQDPPPDVICDAFAGLPFADSEVDEIQAIHLIEHAFVWDVLGVLQEWKRVLKPGGKLVLELPCFDSVRGFIQRGVTDPALTYWPLYGDPITTQEPHAVHKWCYTRKQMQRLLELAGFSDVAQERALFKRPERDMRLTGIKR